MVLLLQLYIKKIPHHLCDIITLKDIGSKQRS